MSIPRFDLGPVEIWARFDHRLIAPPDPLFFRDAVAGSDGPEMTVEEAREVLARVLGKDTKS